MADSTPLHSTYSDETLEELARRLRLRATFLIDLRNDTDDWSFVVKAHAFLESVVCTLLSLHLRKPALEDVLARSVEMQTRIEIMKALGITKSEDRKMMRALGNLRNTLVHNARETSFRFTEHFENKEAKNNFVTTFGQGLGEQVGDPPVTRTEFVQTNPKIAIFHDVVRVAFYVDTEQKALAAEERLQQALSGLREVLSDVPPKEPLK
jgi:hypothetical protein